MSHYTAVSCSSMRLSSRTPHTPQPPQHHDKKPTCRGCVFLKPCRNVEPASHGMPAKHCRLFNSCFPQHLPPRALDKPMPCLHIRPCHWLLLKIQISVEMSLLYLKIMARIMFNGQLFFVFRLSPKLITIQVTGFRL